MNIVKKAYAGLAKFKMVDRGIFKICLVSFSLMLAVLIPALLKVHWTIYAGVFAVSYVYLLVRIFRK